MAKHGLPRSRPVLFFFSLMTPQRNYSTAGRTGRDVIEWMEHYLMTTAFARNSAIANFKGMTLLRRVEAPGILSRRRGRMDGDVLSVRRGCSAPPAVHYRSVDRRALDQAVVAVVGLGLTLASSLALADPCKG